MALSTDDGATFQKLGLIIQSHISRATFHTAPFLGGNVPIGNGPFVLGDAAGNAVDPRTANPSQTYIYVFYVDNQEDLGTADPCAPGMACLAVARALLSDVIAAAFSLDGVTLSGLFRKDYNRCTSPHLPTSRGQAISGTGVTSHSQIRSFSTEARARSLLKWICRPALEAQT